MKPEDFAFIAEMLKRRSGLSITSDRLYLIEGRISPVAKKYGLANLAEVLARLRRGDEGLACAVTEAMTTNESFFFRDKTPFDHFERLILPSLLERRAPQRKLRIWCAASSTGQEPYSLAMIINERAPAGWHFEILGTDIAPGVLAKATEGRYSQFEVQRGLPVQYLLKYFLQEGSQWQINKTVRDMVAFRKFNLLDSFASLGEFDVVFCRNVLIYFDQPTKISILERIWRQMPSDGYLILGAAETVVGLTDHFVPCSSAHGVFLRAESAASDARKVSRCS